MTRQPRALTALSLFTLALVAACERARTEANPAPSASASPAVASSADSASLPDGRLAAEAMMARPAVKAALDTLEAGYVASFDTLITLNEIPAPPFGEGPRGEAMAQRFRDMGFAEVTTDEVGNVIARMPGTGNGRTVAVVAHLDTVFPIETDVTVKREGDTFRAPGIGDNTRGLVMLLSLAQAMRDQGLQPQADILFVAGVGEEGPGNLRGMRHLFRDGHTITSFIGIDGGDVQRLVVSAVGSLRYRVTFSGPGGHSYGAFGRANPHHALGHAIDRFTSLAAPITKTEGAKATYSVGLIGGGTSVNSIPFESWMEVDMRSVDPVKLRALDAALRQAVEEAVALENGRRVEGEPVSAMLDLSGERPAGEGSRASSLVVNAAGAMAAMGITPEFAASSTDANIPIWLGVPAITLSRGGISLDSHALTESWTPDRGALADRIGLVTLLLEAGLAESTSPGGAQ
jgi:acetylornithine deacetylase/succinyl-diaminopimelate desuccinylase-like protein